MSALHPFCRVTTTLVGILALLSLGCASTGGPIAQDRSTCVVIGAVLGGVIGSVVANNAGESETDEELAGGAIGAASGGLLGYLLCGEERLPPQAPSARIVATPTKGVAPLEVSFDAIANDPDGTVVRYAWDLGDGEEARGAKIGHVYDDPGRYEVTLVVTDNDGQTARASTQIQVDAEQAAPEPEPTRRRIVLRGINFGFDSAQISETDGLILDVAAEQISTQPGIRVRVVGHTDSAGAEAYNQRLSERRASAVADYLAGKGIPRSQLTFEGRGESSPVASNDTADGRSQNRRVELEIIE